MKNSDLYINQRRTEKKENSPFIRALVTLIIGAYIAAFLLCIIVS